MNNKEVLKDKKGLLSELCFDVVVIIFQFYITHGRDIVEIRLLNKSFNQLVDTRPNLAMFLYFRIKYNPKSPVPLVYRLDSYYKAQFRGGRPFAEYVHYNDNGEVLFPNLEELKVYSHYTRSMSNIQLTKLRIFNNTFGNISSKKINIGYGSKSITPLKFKFPESLEVLKLNHTDGVDEEVLKTLPITLKSLTFISFTPCTRTLSFLYNDNLNNNLEKLCLHNAGFELNVYEDEIPKFVNLRNLEVWLAVNWRFHHTFVEVVEKLTGKNWGKLKKLKELTLSGCHNESEYKIHGKAIVSREGKLIFPTPLCCDKFGEMFPLLEKLKMFDILVAKKEDIIKLKNLRYLVIAGSTNIDVKDGIDSFKELPLLKNFSSKFRY